MQRENAQSGERKAENTDALVRDGPLRSSGEAAVMAVERRGWAVLYPTMRELDRDLVLWAKRKYKKLRRHLRRATHWIARISRRAPELFAHWQLGARRGSMRGAV